jgi:hypothetical protein
MAAAKVGPAGQPDIAYAPDYTKYLRRGKERLAKEKLQKTLPDGFPDKLHSDLVWEGESVGRNFKWTYELNADEIEEIEKALEYFRCMLMNADSLLINGNASNLEMQHSSCRSATSARRRFRCLS